VGDKATHLVISGVIWGHYSQTNVTFTVSENGRGLETGYNVSRGVVPTMDVYDLRAAHQKIIRKTSLPPKYEYSHIP
jgi:hypothetical protein